MATAGGRRRNAASHLATSAFLITMKRRTWKKTAVIAVAAASLATAAAAYWTSTGFGSGSTSVPSSQQSLVLSAGVPSTALYPGGTAAVAVNVDNANLFR